MQYSDLVAPPVGVYRNEREMADSVLDVLAADFHIEREVPGRYPTGEAVRIDAVLRPIDPTGGFDAQPILGVEFKFPENIDGMAEFGAQIAQAADYAHCTFRDYGRLAVFLCPSPVSQLIAQTDATITSRNRMLPQWRAHLTAVNEHLSSPRTPQQLEADAVRYALDAAHRRLARDASARADGHRDDAHRERSRLNQQATFVTRLLGQLGVGELMPHRYRGWTLLRCGEPVWSQTGGPVRRSGTLTPKVGNR
ncbi:hypothetical protein [Kitasatospora paracochleata]|uniref:Restriction endonuclease n=1 Tax=Kitasatospora paracochleata TaxID=58354 RepID=A0ABT1JA84_9ACTN|nr:hypothetical protein [Kitasatospora paracochleata]MCP2314283.1 hypothetical protein [Kitasatospora paracochleata]